MASGFGPVRHGKRTARFDIRLGGRETQLFLEHQLENPATGVVDKYVWWVRAFDGTKRSPAEGRRRFARGVCERFGAAPGSRRGWRPATRAAPSSGTAHSLATAMPGAAVDAGCGSVYGAVGPELRFGAAELGRRRISRPPDASVSRGGGVWERLRCGCRWHRECCGRCAAMRAAAWLWAARAVLCCSAAPGSRALGRFVDAGWQDSARRA